MLSTVLITAFSFEIVTIVPREQGACSQPFCCRVPFSPVGVTRVSGVAAVGPYLSSSTGALRLSQALPRGPAIHSPFGTKCVLLFQIHVRGREGVGHPHLGLHSPLPGIGV